ncbi:hypothetical protein CPB84DRAFT_1817224 [Gymnopilus junonius]|uniref:Peroxin domain-containing protein n=1 Tax=Gymnopilus junonius TaxID=109634 RepID=A0A9P5THJ2_GYMJU|nr:hypothetical protein CPB84DRAFT_1817224 [Gymnopilus junonius]
MATIDYIDVPLGATQLRNSSDAQHDIRPVPKITTSIPHPSPPPSPSTSRIRRPSLLSSTATSLSSPTLSFIPQLLLSASLPPTKKSEPENVILLSSGDPLSLPIMSTNFKRFVSIIGPVFWLQDRIEEIVLWKRGWMRTAVWMAAYSFLCFYPRVILLLPHIILIGVILATYPYHTVSSGAPLYTIEGDSDALPSTPVAEGSVPWQANIQGIQNLMGAVADAHALIEPYIHHLILTPHHLSPSRPRNAPSPPQQPPSRFPYSPYPPHILTLLALSFPLLLLLIHLPLFPIRETCLLIGLSPFFLTHPRIRPVLPLARPLILDSLPALITHSSNLRNRALKFLHLQNASESESETQKQLRTLTHEYRIKEPPVPLRMTLQRVMDDDRLTDECWNSEMREVQLWENERFGGPLPPPHPSLHSPPPPPTGTGTMMFAASAFAASASSIPMPMPGSGSGSGSNLGSGASGIGSSGNANTGGVQPMQKKGWSKANLRHGERSGWTRGRDGWSGVGGGGAIGGADAVEGGGEVSSNLTFSLAPGWRFVETEDWRKDLQCAWSDGWVYTNDAWIGPRPAPYTSGGGSVTRGGDGKAAEDS